MKTPTRAPLTAALALACAGLLAACATDSQAPVSAGVLGSEAPERAAAPAAADLGEAPIARALEAYGPRIRDYHEHVTTLSNLFFRGRVPGDEGIEVAADYIEWYLERSGLEPLFEDGPDGSFRQTMTLPGAPIVSHAELVYVDGAEERSLEEGVEFNVLGSSASGGVEAPLAFAGYAINEGPHGYRSFEEGALEGHVAMILRFEPMDAEGKSLWSEQGRWSPAAGLRDKIRAAADAGAEAIILVNPPEADDPRAARLLATSSSNYRLDLDIPLVMVDTEAADRLVRAAGADSLLELRRAADRGDEMVAFDFSVRLAADIEQTTIETDNLAAVIRGKGSLAGEYVVMGAHYDHIGFGDFGSRTPDRRGEIHPGADDNASGTSGVLLAAERLRELYEEMPDDADARSIVFLFFTAEESGLNGSRFFVENTPISNDSINIMLNLDMIGRVRESALTVYGTGTAEGLEDRLRPFFDESGLEIATEPGGQGPSDHSSFYSADIPVLAFFSGLHEVYHTPDDESWMINHAGAVATVELAERIALDMATDPDRLEFTSTGSTSRMGSMRNISVRLGIAPGNYADTRSGVAVGEVYEGTSAGLAGIKSGDRLIRWGGQELADIGEMMERLADHKPGDVVEVVVVRDGKEVPIEVTLQARERGGR